MADPFATSDDVASRWRPLTSSEQDIADTLCGDASNILRAEFPGIDGQAASGQIDPDVVTQVVAGMVRRAMIAPADGLASASEGMGPFSRSQTYANPLGNVFLTEADKLLIIGYQPRASSHRFGNTTRHVENCGPGFVYGSP